MPPWADRITAVISKMPGVALTTSYIAGALGIDVTIVGVWLAGMARHKLVERVAGSHFSRWRFPGVPDVIVETTLEVPEEEPVIAPETPDPEAIELVDLLRMRGRGWWVAEEVARICGWTVQEALHELAGEVIAGNVERRGSRWRAKVKTEATG